MNPNSCRIVLRPRGPFEVFDLALCLSRERPGPLLRLLGLTVLPLWLLCFPLCWLAEGAPWLVLLPLVAAPLLQAPFTLLVGRMLFSDEVAVRDTLGELWARIPGLIGAWFGYGLMTLGSGLVCFYPYPLVNGALMYVTETALLERADVSRGISRSYRLAAASATQTGAGVFVRYFLLLWFAAAGEGLGQALVGFVLQLGQPFGAALAGQVTPFLLGGVLLSMPVWAMVRVLLYVDVRTRTEGWDLQVDLRAAGLGR